MRRSAVALLVVTVALSACGGSGGSGERKPEGEAGAEAAGGSEADREAREREEAAKQIPAVDRAAYYQIATTSGLVRARAISARRGSPAPRAGTRQLRAAERALDDLEPRSDSLARLKRILLPVLHKTLRRGLSAHDATAIVAASDRVNAGLRHYLKEEPAQAALVPD
jgi:hypothetical protein